MACVFVRRGCISATLVASQRLQFEKMSMRIGERNALFLMADFIDLFLLNAHWSMDYKQLWLLCERLPELFGCEMLVCMCAFESGNSQHIRI